MSLVLALVGCSHDPEINVASVSWRDEFGQMRAVVGVTDASGAPMELGPKTVVTVETGDGSAWAAATDVDVDLNGVDTVDVAVVADNSGSEHAHEDEIREAVEHFAHVLLTRNHDDRVGLVRVSTEAAVWLPLTSSEDEVAAAAAELYVANGWTALWDGIRLGNDLIAEAAVDATAEETCVSGSFAAIVAFTDGMDNNSADAHASEDYPGDGIDTTAGDAGKLHVFETLTPVNLVGVGDEIDEAALEGVAAASGGDYEAIRNYGGLVGALHGTAAKLSSQVPVCFVPADCGDTAARITIRTGTGKKATEGSADIEIPATCE